MGFPESSLLIRTLIRVLIRILIRVLIRILIRILIRVRVLVLVRILAILIRTTVLSPIPIFMLIGVGFPAVVLLPAVRRWRPQPGSCRSVAAK